jgi:hypothetical protein
MTRGLGITRNPVPVQTSLAVLRFEARYTTKSVFSLNTIGPMIAVWMGTNRQAADAKKRYRTSGEQGCNASLPIVADQPRKDG